MEHIIKCHMLPIPRKQSYFLSRDVTYVTKLVKHMIFYPTRLVTQYALKWLKSLYKEEGKARKIKHIIKRHMIPVPKKKSYFLSRDVTYVTKLVKQTIFHPTRRVTHKSDRTKMVYIKNFSHVIGIHGLKRRQCYSIVATVNASDNRLITA